MKGGQSRLKNEEDAVQIRSSDYKPVTLFSVNGARHLVFGGIFQHMTPVTITVMPMNCTRFFCKGYYADKRLIKVALEAL